ncbi:MAG: peptide chain release factor N(5)-glutamine methyltransferase [Dehalococcoidia bacterium]|nr:peptide chain release factor N(5)-glutamine methyltransferase [Dehalococcoidia bacterium]
MNLAQALQQSAYVLSINGIEDSYIEARMLLGLVANLSSVQIHTEPEQILSREEEGKLQELVDRRLKHEPAAYILKNREFYGIDFYVDSRVLIPRPETEILVDAALEFATGRSSYLKRALLVADIGTGCGAIAINLALNLRGSKVYATDISTSALEVARLNCQHHKVTEQVTLLSGDLVQPIPEPVDLMVANLPYIKNSELTNLSPEIANFEPRMALDGGRNGLDCLQRLLPQVKEKIHTGGCLLLEIGQNQEPDISRLIHNCLDEVNFRFIADYNCIKRAVKIDL